jgi:hypothetical protein
LRLSGYLSTSFWDRLVNHPNPSVRFWALTALEGLPLTAPQVRAARERIPTIPAVRAILDAQYPQGYWMHPGLGISPRYRATVWQVLFLAQLGVARMGPVDRALDVLLDHNLEAMDGFRMRRDAPPSLALTGALLWALGQMGYRENTRLASVWAWARETCARRRATLTLHAATWMLRAAVVWQEEPVIARCADALLKALRQAREEHLPTELYFPVADCFGRLMALEALVEAGMGEHLLPQHRVWLMHKQRSDGFWPLECVPGRLWWDPGRMGEANPWVTIRALKVRKG